MTTRYASTYDPDGDSDFDILMRTWIIDGAPEFISHCDAVNQWDTNALDEAASCADYFRTMPCYADDRRLLQFAVALRTLIRVRYDLNIAR